MTKNLQEKMAKFMLIYEISVIPHFLHHVMLRGWLWQLPINGDTADFLSEQWDFWHIVNSVCWLLLDSGLQLGVIELDLGAGPLWIGGLPWDCYYIARGLWRVRNNFRLHAGGLHWLGFSVLTAALFCLIVSSCCIVHGFSTFLSYMAPPMF